MSRSDDESLKVRFRQESPRVLSFVRLGDVGILTVNRTWGLCWAASEKASHVCRRGRRRTPQTGMVWGFPTLQ
jgi:hypothetical protein